MRESHWVTYSRYSSGARGRTGTRAFMAIGALLDEQHSFMRTGANYTGEKSRYPCGDNPVRFYARSTSGSDLPYDVTAFWTTLACTGSRTTPGPRRVAAPP